MKPADGWEDIKQCILCGGDTKPRTKWARICPDCGLVFISPRPSQALIGRHYSRQEHYDPWRAEEGGRVLLWRRRIDKVLRHARGGRLLDVGAGLGEFIHAAAGHFEGVGTEVSSAAVEFGRKRYGADMRLTSFEEAGFEDGYFNVVSMWHALEHVPFPGRTLAECRRVLAPGGILVIAVPNASWWGWSHLVMPLRNTVKWFANRCGRKYHYDRLYTPIRLKPGEEIHLSHFTPATLARHLANNGFKVVELGLDPYPAKFGAGQKVLYRVCNFINSLTGFNPYPTILVIARKVS